MKIITCWRREEGKTLPSVASLLAFLGNWLASVWHRMPDQLASGLAQYNTSPEEVGGSLSLIS